MLLDGVKISNQLISRRLHAFRIENRFLHCSKIILRIQKKLILLWKCDPVQAHQAILGLSEEYKDKVRATRTGGLKWNNKISRRLINHLNKTWRSKQLSELMERFTLLEYSLIETQKWDKECITKSLLPKPLFEQNFYGWHKIMHIQPSSFNAWENYFSRFVKKFMH